MKTTLLHQNPNTYVIVFETGDEVIANLVSFATAQALDAGHFTAIGAFSDATLGFFDWERKDYKKIPVHAHVVLGKADGAALGGHLMEARVRPTLEVVIVECPQTFTTAHRQGERSCIDSHRLEERRLSFLS